MGSGSRDGRLGYPAKGARDLWQPALTHIGSNDIGGVDNCTAFLLARSRKNSIWAARLNPFFKLCGTVKPVAGSEQPPKLHLHCSIRIDDPSNALIDVG